MDTLQENPGSGFTTMPTRFSSVRYKKRPTVRRPSFRDDSLVAIRYDKTVAGEAPIPIPMRNPLRISTSTRSLSARPVSSSGSFSSVGTVTLAQNNVVVVSPPIGLVEPPAEEHPALRKAPPTKTFFGPHDWKRDSGHGAASMSSTPTITEEDCENEPFTFRSSQESFAPNCVPPEPELGAHKSITEVPSLSNDHDGSRNTISCQLRPTTPRLSTEPAAPRPMTPKSPSRSLSSPSASAKVNAASSPRRRLTKSLSLRRSVSSIRRPEIFATGGKQELAPASSSPSASGPGLGTGIGTAPMQPLERGSPSPGAAKINSSGGTTNTSKLPPPPSSPRWSPTALWKIVPFSRSRSSSTADSEDCFAPLSVTIPTDSLLDDDFISGLSFSKRGSVMFGGQRALSPDATAMDPHPVNDDLDGKAPMPSSGVSQTPTPASPSETYSVSPLSSDGPVIGDEPRYFDALSHTSRDKLDKPQPSPSLPPPRTPSLQQQEEKKVTPDIRVMAADVDTESQKVRSLYAVGAANWEDEAKPSSRGRPSASVAEAPAEENEKDPSARLAPGTDTSRSANSSPLPPEDSLKLKDKETGEQLEDWDDLDGVYIDRYGFISEVRPSSRLGTPSDMKSVQYSPRKRNVLQKRDPSGLSSPLAGPRGPSRKVSARSLHTTHSGVSGVSLRSSRSVVRQASNLLPHNRNRRWMDEAGDMLTVSPSLQDVSEEAKVEKISEALKRKEWERSEKWRKMAKNVKKGSHGQGMEFEFDAKNPKLIERTWKGIPDRWRSAAWWSFLSTAAKNDSNSPSEEKVIADFYRLQQRNSPDDVQIDLDVPRTISRHIMFRKRYRGGQRLLFRVLHALSLYFPETGYVQGMASLGATLLCYFDEEKCFVMLVRMWQLRGLDRLYRPGFEGLMTALHEFESSWLNKEVAKKLTELCIDPTAYGTRWYLTLFNLSIPFPAQLRVWDVFLLLGEGSSEAAEPKTEPQTKKPEATPTAPGTGLDILHATGAALIQALREVLLDSDFENSMKVLTSFITIKDEDLLMKVAKAEWKTHQGKKKA